MGIDEQLMDRVFNSPQLPSMPAIALKIIELVQQDEVDVDKIAKTISLDPALSTKMLKTVNSSFYGQPKTVGSVHQAVVVLGLNSVKTLALGFSLVNNLTGAGGGAFNQMAFWRRSLFSATAAKQFCEELNIVQAEEVFMSSLLQDVGELALAQVLGGQYGALLRKAKGDHRLLSGFEREVLGADHAEVGGKLAESWGLPPLLVESIRLHERPEDAPENLLPLIRTVYAGALAAELIEHPEDEERVGAFYRVVCEWFEMEQPSAESLLRSVFKNASEAQRLFELPTGELGDPDAIMAEAAKALARLNQEGEQAKQALKQTVREQQETEHTDPLTGLPNRRQFDEQLDEHFLHVAPDRPLSVVFVDIDQFDKVNAAHGRPWGDAVLRIISAALRITADEFGVVYRYEDDDFTVLCPGMNRTDAALLAEQLRATVELMECSIGSGDQAKIAKVTASIGVVTYDGSAFKRPEQMVKAASKGVFAAKDGGRNRVRVFVPRIVQPQNEAA